MTGMIQSSAGLECLSPMKDGELQYLCSVQGLAQAEAAAAREAEATARAEQAAVEAAEVRELAQREAAAHESALQEASQKAARLARLEGMPCILPQSSAAAADRYVLGPTSSSLMMSLH